MTAVSLNPFFIRSALRSPSSCRSSRMCSSLRVSIPSSSGRLFVPYRVVARPLGLHCVSIPSSSGRLFVLRQGILDSYLPCLSSQSLLHQVGSSFCWSRECTNTTLGCSACLNPFFIRSALRSWLLPRFILVSTHFRLNPFFIRSALRSV